MQWVVFAIVLIGMVSLLNWHEDRTSEQRLAFAVVTVVAFTLLGSTMV